MNFDNLPTGWNDFSHLSTATQNHVFQVYTNLAMMLSVATLGCLFDLYFEIGGIMTTLLGIGFLIGFSMTNEERDQSKAKQYLFGFSFCNGISVSSLIDYALHVNSSLIVSALGATCLMFVSFSLSVLYSPRRNVFYVAGLLSSSLTMLFWLQLINLFIGSQTGYTIELYLGLVAFSLFVIYDTQIMIAKAEQGSKKVLQHSLDLFIDFVSVFVRVLRVLLRKEEEKERKRRKRQSD